MSSEGTKQELIILSCGIFKPELEKILPGLKSDLNVKNIEIVYVPPALHEDNNKLEKGIRTALIPLQNKKIALLYGNMCHPEMQKIAAVNSIPHKDGAVPFLKVHNCIDAFLSPEKKHELDAGMNVHYMSAGWIKFWKDIFAGGPGWDPVTARMMLGVNDKIVILDTGCVTLSEEEIFEIFDYIQLPIEVEKITLDYFKNMIFELCVKALNL